MPCPNLLIFAFVWLWGSFPAFGKVTTRLITDWHITLNGQAVPPSVINYTWSETGKAEDVTFTSHFVIEDLSEPLSLIVPPTWLSYHVYINDLAVFDDMELGKFPGNIYEAKIVRIPMPILHLGDNSIEIKTSGQANISGFKGDYVTVTSNPDELRKIGVFNFWLNGIHTPLLMFSIFLMLFCLMLMTIERFRTYEYYLMLGYIACSLPYVCLATDLYAFFGLPGVWPFKMQQVFQAYLWFCCAIFVLLKTNKRQSKTSQLLLNRKAILWIFSAPTTFFLLSLFVSDAHFFVVSKIYFSFAILVFCVGFFFIHHGVLLRYAYLLGVMIAILAMYSDITKSNIYLFVYSFVTMNVVGVATMVKEIEAESRLNHLGQQFMNQFLPRTAFDSIMAFIKKGKNYQEVLETFRGSKTLAVVLIDICDWGKLNHFADSKIPEHFILKARNYAFTSFENIMDSFGFELIKVSGDDMMFCGGLAPVYRQDSEIAKNALGAIVAVLESIDKINSKLREDKLPYLEIKVSASYGKASYGIEKYSSRGTFDIQGHTVNVAYRIEQGIDKDVYEKFGKNLAVVEESIFNDCDDMELISRFKDTIIIGDKHSIFYPCRVAKQYKENVDLKDFSEALYSFFRTKDTAPLVPVDKEVEKVVPLKRERVDLGENLIVILKTKDLAIQGNIIDFGSDTLRIAVERGLEPVTYGQMFVIQYQLWEQKFTNDGKIIGHYTKQIDHITYDVLEVQIMPPERGAKMRRNCRFAIDYDEHKPTAQIRNPFSLKNTCNLELRNISSEGFATNCPPDFTLFPGVTVDAEISFPFTESVKCKAVVRHITRPGQPMKEGMVGFETVSNFSEFHERGSAFLLNTKRDLVTPNYLRTQGYTKISLERAITFRYLETENDLIDIAKLRLNVWQSVGMFLDKTEKDHEDMLDHYDREAKHILAYHGNILVGSARVVFNHGKLDTMEHNMYNVEIPPWLAKKKFVEFSRAVIDEKYREGVLWFSMLFHMGRLLLESGHDIALISSTKKLYRKIYSVAGFKKICEFPCEEEPYYLMYVDMRKIVDGRTIRPVAWTLGYKELHYHLKRQGRIQESLVGTFGIGLQKIAEPIIEKAVG